MSRKKSSILALSLITLASFSPAAADPVEVSKLDTTALRALFHSPAFNVICPLEVYDEDYSQTKIIQSSTPVPSQTLETTRAKFPTFAVSEFLRSPDSTFSDGLETYGEDFTNADL